jgi:integrase
VETVVEMLTDRQQRVCELLSQGCSKAATARELGCGWHTVDRIVRDICGPDRAMIYLIAAWTGFRKGEIGSLTIQSLDLDSGVCTATVAAAFSKRRREDTQVLHPYLVERLRAWLAARGPVEPDELLFPISARAGVTVTHPDGAVYYRRPDNAASKKPTRRSLPAIPQRKTHYMMRDDLAAARRCWIAEAEGNPEEHRRRQRSDLLSYRNHAGLYADFHSIRHTFITSLCRADISPKTAQTLARHSDIRLTMEVYTHVDRQDQIAAIHSLPAPQSDVA